MRQAKHRAHGRSMGITILRNDAPGWKWTAARAGFGTWRYHGTMGDQSIMVRCQGVACGPGDDDYAVQWVADDGQVSRSLSLWLLEAPGTKYTGETGGKGQA